MDERTLQRKPGFAALAQDMNRIFAQVIAEISGDLMPRQIAAE